METPDVVTALLRTANSSERGEDCTFVRDNDTAIALLTPLKFQFSADLTRDGNDALSVTGAFGELVAQSGGYETPAFFWPDALSQAQKHASELAMSAALERLAERGGHSAPQLDWLRDEGLL